MLKKIQAMQPEISPQALSRWNPAIRARAAEKEGDADTVINIYSTIGEYYDGSGMTAKIMSGILRAADGKDVVVNMNSPGGDFFEGITLYSMLKDYPGKVSIRVLGIAASAASVVAMAGDEVEIAESGFFMIHNAWTIALGNKNDFEAVHDMLAKFDDSMIALYEKHTGISQKEIAKMMDAETWLSGPESVERGFAARLMDGDEIDVDEKDDAGHNASLRKVDMAMAAAGLPRGERRKLIKDLTGKPGAADEPKPSAGTELTDAISAFVATCKQTI